MDVIINTFKDILNDVKWLSYIRVAAYNKKEELRDQMVKLAKIHYATID